jgi:hypothetical protein
MKIDKKYFVSTQDEVWMYSYRKVRKAKCRPIKSHLPKNTYRRNKDWRKEYV